MKLRYLTTIVVLVMIFSLATVAASENVTNDALSIDDASLAIGNDYNSIDEKLNVETDSNQDVLTDENTSADGIDLSVKIDVKNAYVKNRYNIAGTEVPWTITLKVENGTAYNTKVQEILSDNLRYISHNTTMGEYDSITGIWNVGDLSSSDNASLTILTGLITDGRFKNTANATTDSYDINLKNNIKSLTIKTGSSKTSSNYTETSDDKHEADHSNHQFSENTQSAIRQQEDTPVDKSNTNSVDNGIKSKEVKKSESSSSPTASPSASSNPTASPSASSNPSASSSSNNINENNGDLSSKANSITQEISKTFESLSNSVLSILDPGSSGLKEVDSNSSDSPNSPVKAIAAYNYIQIPILIFALFLIIILPMLAYDKIKS